LFVDVLNTSLVWYYINRPPKPKKKKAIYGREAGDYHGMPNPDAKWGLYRKPKKPEGV
jgi:hypothetical protein